MPVEFYAGGRRVYAQSCLVLKQSCLAAGIDAVLEPAEANISVLGPKKYRSERTVLTPLPDLVFQHPLTGGEIFYKVIRISGTGLEVAESPNRTVNPAHEDLLGPFKQGGRFGALDTMLFPVHAIYASV